MVMVMKANLSMDAVTKSSLSNALNHAKSYA